MQIEKREYEVYNFDELSDEAKQKALEEFYDINVDDPYWYYLEEFEEIAERYGLKVDFAKMYFDLDRGAQVYFDEAIVSDPIKLLKLAGITGKRAKELEDYLTVKTQHFGGGSARNYIDSTETTGDEDQKLAEVMKDLEAEELKALRSLYNHLTSEEAIKDTIEANEYQFTVDGKFFTL